MPRELQIVENPSQCWLLILTAVGKHTNEDFHKTLRWVSQHFLTASCGRVWWTEQSLITVTRRQPFGISTVTFQTGMVTFSSAQVKQVQARGVREQMDSAIYCNSLARLQCASHLPPVAGGALHNLEVFAMRLTSDMWAEEHRASLCPLRFLHLDTHTSTPAYLPLC